MKLNKKGFTLIELLAVIVILAIILVITIPTVLGSISSARKGSFESAVKTIKTYVENQYGMSSIGETTTMKFGVAPTSGEKNYILIPASSTGTVSGEPTNTFDVVKNAGYDTTEFDTGSMLIYINLKTGVACVAASVGSNSKNFNGVSYSGQTYDKFTVTSDGATPPTYTGNKTSVTNGTLFATAGCK